MRESELQAFRRTYGQLGDQERRTFKLSARMNNTGDDPTRLKVIGHAAVFGSPQRRDGLSDGQLR